MLAAIVSIHTRHYWRVKPAGQAGQLDYVAVSIHTRHYWRVKRFDASTCCTAPVSFNPHPPLLAGETCALARASKIGFMRFNPHPPLLAGETAIATLPQAEQTVSIHTRHYWRVKLVGRPHAQFLTGFNPHPPLLAGETIFAATYNVAQLVSIHTRHYWRVKRPFPLLVSKAVFVSIHTRHYWRVKRHGCRARVPATCFNPHPPLLAGETVWAAKLCANIFVSIHTRHYWRVKPVRAIGGSADGVVSIHTRHYWRVKRLVLSRRFISVQFQSTPAITGG